MSYACRYCNAETACLIPIRVAKGWPKPEPICTACYDSQVLQGNDLEGPWLGATA